MGDVNAPISISGLRRTFGHIRALDGLDLEVAQGQVHGFLGPNGAGKTTTIRILLGLIAADAPSCSRATPSRRSRPSATT